MRRSSSMASKRETTPSKIIRIKTNTGTIAQVLSLAKKSRSGLIVLEIRKIVPKTSVMLRILLPMTLAMAICGFPSALAAILAAISGRLVPNAISVAPMINSEILNFIAIRSLSLTSRSAPQISAAIAMTKMTKFILLFLLVFCTDDQAFG